MKNKWVHCTLYIIAYCVVAYCNCSVTQNAAGIKAAGMNREASNDTPFKKLRLSMKMKGDINLMENTTLELQRTFHITFCRCCSEPDLPLNFQSMNHLEPS